MKTTTLLTWLLISISFRSFAQVNTDQNGIKTFVTNSLGTSSTQPLRYEIATVSYNSHHWQQSGSIIIEVFHHAISVGYQKYILQVGYHFGTQGSSPKLILAEMHDEAATSRISLGIPYDLSSSIGGYINKALPIYFDVQYYSGCKVKITYLQTSVSSLTDHNQIVLNQSPTGSNISSFEAPSLTNNNISTSGNAFIGGNVGIGTTNIDPHPFGGKLNVAGSISSNGGKIGWGVTDAFNSYGYSAAHYGMSYDLSVNPVTISGYYGLGFFSDFKERMRITIAGNVGIGTPAPAFKLDIADAHTIRQTSNVNYAQFNMKNANGSSWLVAYEKSLRFYAGQETANPDVTIAFGGNVGIGTISPQSKLAVNGDVFAKKVKVTQSGWPDYVFNKEYELMPLTDVEAFILKYKHLPKVPSAAEIEKNDLDLGEMNKVLLQKVEELTLYLIEMQKEKALLEQRVTKLEQK